MRLVAAFLFIALISPTQAPSAQFGPPPQGGQNSGSGGVRLDTHPAVSANPAIAISGRFVYAVWEDYRGGTALGDIFLRRSFDGGYSWLPFEVPLEIDPAQGASSPVIATSGPFVFVAWRGWLSPTLSHVFCRVSTDFGSTWQGTVVVDSGNDVRAPKIALSGPIGGTSSVAVLTWEDWRGSATHPYVFARRVIATTSTTLGIEVRLDPTDAGTSMSPDIVAVGSAVYVTWTEPGAAYAARSLDGGSVWGARQAIGGGAVYLPQISASGSAVHVTWYLAGLGDIWYARSLDYGANWESQVRLDTSSNGLSLYPDIASLGPYVFVAWSDSSATLGDIMVRFSANAGATWSSESVLDSQLPSDESYYAQVYADSNGIGITWEQGSHGQRDIYLSRFVGNGWIRTRVDSSGPNANSVGVKLARNYLGSLVIWMDNRSDTTTTTTKDIYCELLRP
jgi:hypothetical protein